MPESVAEISGNMMGTQAPTGDVSIFDKIYLPGDQFSMANVSIFGQIYFLRQSKKSSNHINC